MIRFALPLFALASIGLFLPFSAPCLAAAESTPAVQPEDQFTKQVQEIVGQCDEINEAKTREELLKVFQAGKRSQKLLRCTFTHRKFPVVKIDVEFEPDKEKPDEASDKIRSISKPFLLIAKLD